MRHPAHARKRQPRTRRFRFTAGLVVGSIVMLGATAATAATGAFNSGSFSLGCNVTGAGAVSCSGNLPTATTTTTTKPPATTTTTTTKPPATTTTTKPPTTTTTTVPPTTTTTQPGGMACTSVWPPDSSANCNYSDEPYITGATVNGEPYVDSNVWTQDESYLQTLTAYAPNDWNVTANANTGFGGVEAFPNTGFFTTGKVDSSSAVTSSWNVTIPQNQTTAAWATYDLWFNNWNNEVQIHVDQTVPSNGDYNCDSVAETTIDGQPWHLCVFGSEDVWKAGVSDTSPGANMPSGSLNILPFLQWEEANGYLPAGSTWTAASFGFEICDTHGVTETFGLNNFTWAA